MHFNPNKSAPGLQKDQLQQKKGARVNRGQRKFMVSHKLTSQQLQQVTLQHLQWQTKPDEKLQLQSKKKQLTGEERELSQAKEPILLCSTTFSQPLTRLKQMAVFQVKRLQLYSFNKQLWWCRTSRMRIFSKTCNWLTKCRKKKKRENLKTSLSRADSSQTMRSCSLTSWVKRLHLHPTLSRTIWAST